MPHEQYIRNASEDWAGITDPKGRKKMQNRLNKRICKPFCTHLKGARFAFASSTPWVTLTQSFAQTLLLNQTNASHFADIRPARTRKRALKSLSPDLVAATLARSQYAADTNAAHLDAAASSPSPSSSSTSTSATPGSSFAVYHNLDHDNCHAQTQTGLQVCCPLRDVQVSFSVCSAETIAQKRAALRRFADHALKSYATADPCADHSLRLIQLNLINGLTRNAVSLGFDFDWLVCEVVSPFGSDQGRGSICQRRRSPTTASFPASSPIAAAPSMPTSLAPTSMQLKTRHHPWVDLFPLPTLRNNLLVAAQVLSPEDEQELYNDVLESGGGRREWAGLVVWGEPWDPKNWEVSEPFLKKWNWVLSGCQEILESTNYWRTQRGEEPIVGMSHIAVCEHPLPVVEELCDNV